MHRLLSILLLSLLLLPAPAAAEKLYKFVDANGQITFTDKEIGAGTLQSVEQVKVEKPAERFSVQNRGSKAEPVLYAINGYFGPIEAEFTLKDVRNMKIERHTPVRTTVPATSDLRIITMRQANPRQGYAYAWETRSVLGDPKAKHQPERPYLLPLPPGESFRVSQGFFGKATHASHVQSEYAIDIPMPEGTPIFAVRSGIIMDVAVDFFDGGATPEMMEQANYVRVLHDDGTMAVYAHLALETVNYPIGNRIERGQLLARSGNTGFSTGPHLHFVIQKNYGMELRSVPFEFEGENGAAFTPVEGMVLMRKAIALTKL